MEALQDLDALLLQQESAARDFARNPRDSSKKAKLDDTNRRIARDLDAITAGFDGAAANAEKGMPFK